MADVLTQLREILEEQHADAKDFVLRRKDRPLDDTTIFFKGELNAYSYILDKLDELEKADG